MMYQNHIKLYFICFPVTLLGSNANAAQPKRPNFVFFMAEDISAQCLQLFTSNGSGALTPNLTKWADDGVVFNNAFCNSPVSSAARSTFITGCYANRLGLSLHRKLQAVDLPDDIKMFPSYLNQSGYYTANSKKTDYNCNISQNTWDTISDNRFSWRERKDKNSPFLQEITSMTCHESCLHFDSEGIYNKKTNTNPDFTKLYSFHPNTPLFRYTYATLYDKINQVDAEFEQLMSALIADGEIDNTFVFFFGDNGGSVPGTKGFTNELGLHVPLVVYIPKNWRDKIGIPTGKRVDGFINFVDFAPTLLHLAGLKIPKHLDGKVFLSKEINLKIVNKRNETWGYGDRYDEQYAFTRTFRKGNIKYSRNFHPYQPRNFFNDYRSKQLALQEWQLLNDQSKLNNTQSQFFIPQVPEELYDLSSDPFETNNLATDINHKKTLIKMRKHLKMKMIEDCDLGLFPEAEWLNQAGEKPVEYAHQNKIRIAHFSDIADLMLLPYAKVRMQLKKTLTSNDPVERYWGLSVCTYFGIEAIEMCELALILQNDSSSIVKSKATLFLAIVDKTNPVTSMKSILENAKTEAEKLMILNDMAVLKQNLKVNFFLKSNNSSSYLFDNRNQFLKD